MSPLWGRVEAYSMAVVWQSNYCKTLSNPLNKTSHFSSQTQIVFSDGKVGFIRGGLFEGVSNKVGYYPKKGIKAFLDLGGAIILKNI